MYFSSTLLQEAIREAHPLNKSKQRKHGIQETTYPTPEDVEGISQNEGERQPPVSAVSPAWRTPEGAGDGRWKGKVSKEKSKTEKAHDVLGNVGIMLKSVLQFFF